MVKRGYLFSVCDGLHRRVGDTHFVEAVSGAYRQRCSDSSSNVGIIRSSLALRHVPCFSPRPCTNLQARTTTSTTAVLEALRLLVSKNHHLACSSGHRLQNMKFTIATGIIATQTLPVISEESHPSKKNNPVDFVEDDDLSAPLPNNIIINEKRHHPQRTGTKSRTLSILWHGRRPLSGNKFLMNNRASLPKDGNTFCDPSSEDADIGILSCGLGHECMVDEASTLGGVCASLSSRQLQQNETCTLCPYGFTMSHAYYDVIIDSEDTESGYGGKTCESTIDPAYNSLQLDASSCAAVASAVQAAGCCGPKCQLCDLGSRVFYTDENAETVVHGISIPGYEDGDVTCKTLVGASYIMGMINVESCPATRQVAKEAGCCGKWFCSVCDSGSYISPYLNATTCNDLSPAQLSYYMTTLSEKDCLVATQLAEDEGCCTSRPVYKDCNVCGNATFYPENIVFRTSTCDYFQSVANAETCATYSHVVAPFCCGPDVPVEVTEGPSPSPDESTEEPVAKPPLSASSASRWPTGSIVCSSTIALSAGVWLMVLH